MIYFVCDGEKGSIDQYGFITWGGNGFHIQDVRFNKKSNLVKTLREVLKGTEFEKKIKV